MEREIEEFNIYAEPYIEVGDSCVLKIDHTFRVVKLCEEIAKNLGLNEEDIYIAKMCGLLHDIARFEQWKRYETFKDLESIDHGDLGYEILTENNFIRRFLPDDKYDSIILNSVRFHNKYEVPDDLNERERLFLNIIRDADKIDILYLYTIEHLGIETDDKEMTDSVYNQLINMEQIKRGTTKTEVDNLSISLGFIFDINYICSLKILKEKAYLNKEIDIYQEKTTNKKLVKQLENIRNVINNYTDKKINENRGA